ncbi:putative quinol monooxygenase [Curtobacterium sp. 22159]|uniref:putative quinol monooxygenase n=1 Tax=Curtobacterium sp. 22159 TaxID=3453882 RepID=UPI003F8296BC
MFETTKPGVLLKMRARSGEGDALAKVLVDVHYEEDVDGPVDWVVMRDDEDRDVLRVVEFYRDQESFDRHYAESNDEVEQRHEQIIALLGEAPERVVLHPVASS